jgi:prepilin-type N-terminal cleavage/methylation domain-containing protein
MQSCDQKLNAKPELRSNNSAGFSLVELLIVVALIGLVGILVVPGIGNVFKVSMNFVTCEIVGKIKKNYRALF